jgi:hypothetical protein
MIRKADRLVAATLVAILFAAIAPNALAGGGPETTLVVVNANSPASRLVANEYIRLRDIPEGHVVMLSDIPHLGVVTLEFFKEHIWAPIAAHLKERGLEDQIDLITYSVDFPYGVNFAKVLDVPNPGHQIGKVASLTGVTYLIRHVLAGDPFWNLQINRYFRFAAAGAAAPVGARAPTEEERKLSGKAQTALAAKDYAAAAAAFEKLLETWRDSNHLYNYACCLARLGRDEEALQALAAASEHGFTNPRHAAADPDLARLRALPEFARILSGMQRASTEIYPAHGFRSTYGFTGREKPDISPARTATNRYYLSTQLGYTGRYGNSTPEVLECLTRAAACDGTNPDGTVYICRNENIRSTAREKPGFFQALTAGLTKLGRKVSTLEKGKDGQTGIIPVGRKDVIGAVVGTAGFSWGKSGSEMLPGAIAEHLTSFGAHFGTPGQTKLSEFIRFGAAGASGTVAEPLALHMKFPNPMIHVFYAEGCSLAEAFYQSIWGPYQLMVAGDGLARPFATFTKVKVKAPKGPWSGTVQLIPEGDAESFELWVDGKRSAVAKLFVLDTKKLDDGHHDVRVVAVAKGPIETRSHMKLDAIVANQPLTPRIEASGPTVVFGETIEVTARGVREIEVLSAGRVVARTTKSTARVDSTLIGPGPVTLVPRLVLTDGAAYRGKPIEIDIVLPDAAEPQPTPHPTLPGLRGTAKTKDGEREIAVTNLGDARGGKVLSAQLRSLGAVEELTLGGEFEVTKGGFQELSFAGSGELSLSVGGVELAKDQELAGQRAFALSLAPGWHPIRFTLKPLGPPKLEVFLSGEQIYDAPHIRHASREALKSEPTIEGAKPGQPIPMPVEGLVLEFKRSTKDVSAIVLTPPAEVETFPLQWVVEVPSGRSKYKELKGVEVLVGQGAKAVPMWIELSFPPARVKGLRIRPKGTEGAAVKLGTVQVRGRKLN